MGTGTAKTSGALGRAVGWAVAPVFGLVSFARRARTFHPHGDTYHAWVAAWTDPPPELAPIAQRLVGPALVRFSAALWKHVEGPPDVLGCAIRFRHEDTDDSSSAPDDLDLLFATIRRPWTMPFSPFATNVRDYLGNDYFAVEPFDVGLPRPVYLRLHPAHARHDEGRRAERLAREVARGEVLLNLDVGTSPFGPWEPLLVVLIERPADVDDRALRFHPTHPARGVTPRGFVSGLRDGVYAVSQWARRLAARKAANGTSRASGRDAVRSARNPV